VKKLVVFILGSGLLFLAACGSDDGETNGDTGGDGETAEGTSKLDELRESGTVTVGFANEKPYAYEEGGELKGASVDIARAVFEELGVENMESQLADFGQLIAGVQAGQFDVVTAGMAIQPDRCENALFSEPDMQYGEGLVVEAGNPLDIHSYADIADNPDITVVVMEGATEIGFLQEEGVDESQITTASDIPSTFSAVQAGRADATTGTEMTVRMALESFDSDDLEFVETFEQPDIEGVPSYGAAAFSLDNEELRDAYNEVLEQLKEDGTVDELLEANGFSAELNSVEVGEVTTEELCSGEM
jgi:polar amino acid transport system substrate-binding protein